MTKRKNGHCDILQSIRAFCQSEKGSVLPLVGIGFFVIMGVMGMAIDIGRGQLVESKLLNSIDAAGLAAGAKLNTCKPKSKNSCMRIIPTAMSIPSCPALRPR